MVREHNVYRWAGNLIAELCEVRLDVYEGGVERHQAAASVGGRG